MYYYIFSHQGVKSPSFKCDAYHTALQCAAEYFEVNAFECQLVETDDVNAHRDYGIEECLLTAPDSKPFADKNDDYWLPDFDL